MKPCKIPLTLSAALLAFVAWRLYQGSGAHHDLDARPAVSSNGPSSAADSLSSTPRSTVVAGVQSSLPASPSNTAPAAPGNATLPQTLPDALGDEIAAVDGEAFQADAAGLYALTTDLWSQEGFANLTTEEARALLPVASDELGTLPTTIHALVGDFPTMADCESAWRSKDVQRADRDFLVLEILVTQMQTCPQWRRNAAFHERLTRMSLERTMALTQLYEACDKAGPYKNWALVGRLFAEWERQ